MSAQIINDGLVLKTPPHSLHAHDASCDAKTPDAKAIFQSNQIDAVLPPATLNSAQLMTFAEHLHANLGMKTEVVFLQLFHAFRAVDEDESWVLSTASRGLA